jgi:hypothetical protein
LSQNYQLQCRDDESEALSGAASERFKIAITESNLLALSETPLVASLHRHDFPRGAVMKLVPSDIDIWIKVIQQLNLQPNTASSYIMQQLLQLNLVSQDDALRMMPYAAHLKIAAFSQAQKR